jgi:hypothetical protein
MSDTRSCQREGRERKGCSPSLPPSLPPPSSISTKPVPRARGRKGRREGGREGGSSDLLEATEDDPSGTEEEASGRGGSIFSPGTREDGRKGGREKGRGERGG